jgi:opacity protein-like surface antigen
MKKSIFIAFIVALMLPAVASAQLITSAQVITVKEKRPEIPGHYEQSIEFTAATDFEDKGGDRSVYGIEYIGGFRFSNLFFLGAGIGINFHSFSDELSPMDYSSAVGGYYNCPENLISVPLYVHARLYFTNTRCQPFIALSVGGQITGRKYEPGHYDIGYNPSCFLISPQLGVNYDLNQKTSIYLTAGCLVRDIVDVYNSNRNEEYRSMEEGVAFKMCVGVTF